MEYDFIAGDIFVVRVVIRLTQMMNCGLTKGERNLIFMSMSLIRFYGETVTFFSTFYLLGILSVVVFVSHTNRA